MRDKIKYKSLKPKIIFNSFQYFYVKEVYLCRLIVGLEECMRQRVLTGSAASG